MNLAAILAPTFTKIKQFVVNAAAAAVAAHEQTFPHGGGSQNLGTAAYLDVGTGAGDVAAGDAPAAAVAAHEAAYDHEDFLRPQDLPDVLAGRASVTVSTVPIAPGADAYDSIPISKSFALLKVTVTRACWLRLYQTAAHRTADVGRASNSDPKGDHGVICEVLFLEAGALALQPPPIGINLDPVPSSSIPYACRNLSDSAGSVGITLNWLSLELEG